MKRNLLFLAFVVAIATSVFTACPQPNTYNGNEGQVVEAVE